MFHAAELIIILNMK